MAGRFNSIITIGEIDIIEVKFQDFFLTVVFLQFYSKKHLPQLRQ